MSKRKRIVLVVAEMSASTDAEIDLQLDAFRESVKPSAGNGITISRATGWDVRRFNVNSDGIIRSVPGELD